MKRALSWFLITTIFIMTLALITKKAREWKLDKPKNAASTESRLVEAIENLKNISDQIRNSPNVGPAQKEAWLDELGIAKAQIESLKIELGDTMNRYKNELEKYLENLNKEFYKRELEPHNESGMINPEDIAADLSYVVHISETTLTPSGVPVISHATGMVINLNDKPYILTAGHIIDDTQMPQIFEAFFNYRIEPQDIEFVSRDQIKDLALFKFSNPDFRHAGRFAEFESSADLKVGSPIMVAGSPCGLKFYATFGRVAKTDLGIFSDWMGQTLTFTQPRLIAHDATINPGNSGGPLISLKTGKVVGVNISLLWGAMQVNNFNRIDSPIAPVYLAVPAEDVIKSLPLFLKGPEVRHGIIDGVFVASSWNFSSRYLLSLGIMPIKESGVIVMQIFENSPNKDCGLKLGDIVKSVNGKEVKTYIDFYCEVIDMSPGDTVKISAIRAIPPGGEEEFIKLEVEVPITEYKAE